MRKWYDSIKNDISSFQKVAIPASLLYVDENKNIEFIDGIKILIDDLNFFLIKVTIENDERYILPLYQDVFVDMSKISKIIKQFEKLLLLMCSSDYTFILYESSEFSFDI